MREIGVRHCEYPGKLESVMFTVPDPRLYL